MAIPLEKFIQKLEDSGIVAGETLKDFIPPSASPQSAEELALELVRQKKLTKLQAKEISKGKAKSLTLGNYVLMAKIGAGGMGQVFKAHHRRMKRVVAVKLLPPPMTKDKAAIARFEREVKAAAKTNHPNIDTRISLMRSQPFSRIKGSTAEVVDSDLSLQIFSDDHRIHARSTAEFDIRIQFAL